MKALLALLLFVLACHTPTEPIKLNIDLGRLDSEYELFVEHAKPSPASVECEIWGQLRLHANGSGWAVGATTCNGGRELPLRRLLWTYSATMREFALRIENLELHGHRELRLGTITGKALLLRLDHPPGTGRFTMLPCVFACFPVEPK